MQKITPFLWFDTQAEEAAKLYTSLFPGSSIGNVRRYGDAGPGPKGQVMTLTFKLPGLEVMALNGGPEFGFTPAGSLFVSCATEKEINALWKELSAGGEVFMPLQKYPFSQKFGWAGDRYGLSWQLNLGAKETRVTPFLTFVGKLYGKTEEALKYWTSLFKDSKVEHVERDGAAVKHALFTLGGQQFMAMESDLEHTWSFNEAFSLFVDCKTQDEVDELWEKLTDGGKESMCGWLQDRYGVSWQIVPSAMMRLLGDKNPARSQAATLAMLKMRKLDIKALQAAADGAAPPAA